jgi:hypothetical protein
MASNVNGQFDWTLIGSNDVGHEYVNLVHDGIFPPSLTTSENSLGKIFQEMFAGNCRIYWEMNEKRITGPNQVAKVPHRKPMMHVGEIISSETTAYKK